MNVTDLATGLKIGSYVHPAGPPQQRNLGYEFVGIYPGYEIVVTYIVALRLLRRVHPEVSKGSQ